MIRAPEVQRETAEDNAVQMVRGQAPKDEPSPDAEQLPASTPAQPPAAPPSLARPALPTIGVAPIAVAPEPTDVAIANAGAPVSLGSGLGLGSSGVFGGLARGGCGGGGGVGSGGGNGGGYGGESFRGKDLVPLSTARPQMPDWACKQKIKGWVEAMFTVGGYGHVTNVRIVDAQPRGVYEAAAIESISNWIYKPVKEPIEVDQRVEMDPEDCQYNWH
jgi:outer membrane biosynthesis protein TonB